MIHKNTYYLTVLVDYKGPNNKGNLGVSIIVNLVCWYIVNYLLQPSNILSLSYLSQPTSQYCIM